MSRQRFNIIVSIKRGEHDWYTYAYNRQPVRPGKVASSFSDAIEDTMNNVTRGHRHDYVGGRTDTLFFAQSGTIIVLVKVVQA